MNVEKIVREYIDKTMHLSLATVRDNKPWVCEVHFAYDEDLNLYFRSLKTRRHSQEIAQNPNVAGNIVRQHSLEEAPVGIYFEGIAKLLPEGAERQKAFECMRQRLKADDSILEEANKEGGHQFYKITVAKWYAFGKFNDDGSKKYDLVWKNDS